VGPRVNSPSAQAYVDVFHQAPSGLKETCSVGARSAKDLHWLHMWKMQLKKNGNLVCKLEFGNGGNWVGL
jgi:hypothetical protein